MAATIGTKRFDAGTGTAWYLIPPPCDSGDELRDSVVKAVHFVGKLTSPNFRVYKYSPGDVIDVSAIMAGTGSATGSVSMTTTTGVARTPRKQINVKNAMIWIIRLAGDCTGTSSLDRIDEIAVESAQQGVRR